MIKQKTIPMKIFATQTNVHSLYFLLVVVNSNYLKTDRVFFNIPTHSQLNYEMAERHIFEHGG